MVPHFLLPSETRPTWAYPERYVLALAFSVLSMPLLLTRLAVMSARSRGRARLAAFPCSAMSTRNDLGPLCAPTAICSRGNGQQYPTWQRTFLVQAYQPLWLVSTDCTYEHSFSLTLSCDSSGVAWVRLQATATLSGGLQTCDGTRHTPASVEYLRRNAGLNQDCIHVKQCSLQLHVAS